MIDEDLAGGGCDSPTTVPLGGPLLGTRIELRDEDGTPVDEGSGFIWIGESNYAIALQKLCGWYVNVFL